MSFFHILLLEIAANWSLLSGDYTGALTRLEALLKAQEARYPENPYKTVQTRLLLAHCFQKCGVKGKFEKAFWIYFKALDIAESSDAPNKDLMIGKIAGSFGSWYSQDNTNDIAEKMYQKSIEAFCRAVGDYSKRLLEPLYGRASALRSLGRKAEAEPLEEWAKQIEAAQRYMDQYEYHGHYPRF